MQVTEYEYDTAGRLVRATTTTEPEWSPGDVDLMLAAAAADRETGPHGHPLWESTSDEASPTNYSSTLRYVAGPILTDWAEKARRDAEDKFRKQFPNESLNGRIFTVKKIGGT